MADKKGYYIGLDCGTSSVGWAVTDEEYRLLRAKGKTMWGVRLFDEAKTAADRRLQRGVRRRNDRADNRLKLLRMLFCDEIAKVDPDFYLRLDESFYRQEDKRLENASADTLFDDLAYKDKDFHKKYPTIWHLRKAIIEAGVDECFDIRLYFLAIQHIMKHRGHFLREGELKGKAGNFEELYAEFCNAAENAGFYIREDNGAKVEKIVCDRNLRKLDAKRQLKEVLFDQDKFDARAEFEDGEEAKDYTALAGLLVGSSVDLRKLFGMEGNEKVSASFEGVVVEDKMPDWEAFLGNAAYVDLIWVAKNIYDYVILRRLLGDDNSISEAMVRNYDLHRADLKRLKELFKPLPELYDYFFKTEKVDNAETRPNYNGYIGRGYSGEDTKGRRKAVLVSQENLNKYVARIIKDYDIKIEDEEFARRLENGELLPKQRGQAKGTIPQQLHHNELEKILKKLVADFPSFAREVPGENVEYNTKCKKIAQIHSFRRPYYCGPLVTEKKSNFSWADEEINEIVYPWNFKELVDLDARAEKFIVRMTNDCTYLLGEKVLPKASPLYQKYMVLNEINNLKVNGYRIEDKNIKDKIHELFESGELTGNITLRRLEKELKARAIIAQGDELGGTAEQKFLPKLSTHQDFKRALGDDYTEKYAKEKIEEAVKAITILGEEKKMLAAKLRKVLGCSDEEAKRLAKLSYKDWGKFSAKFLSGIKVQNGTRSLSLIDALEETGDNLMELLTKGRGYREAMEEFNAVRMPERKEIIYDDVKALYCSPAVKRSVWQAVRIVKELVEIEGEAPKKIFLESTREEADARKGETLARKKRLMENYAAMGTPEARQILEELEGKDDRDLQSKKLYLYYQQMCKCAYCGKTLYLEDLVTTAYDIDHIYPQSLTKDDSITRNKVLVCAEHNRVKSNRYPIDAEIREKMKGVWGFWARNGFITKEKYERLTRSTPLTDEELGGFIARQIVETSQSVKAIRDLFRRAYPDTKIVLVKAGQVSDLRHFYGYDKKDREGNVVQKGRPEFIKVRALNDLHHAKDAYLNIVVGNVMSETFTDDPVNWIRKNHAGDDKHYSIKTGLLFRSAEIYKNRDGEERRWPVMRGWGYEESLRIVSDALKRNDVLWTRMPYEQSGQLFDLQIVGKIADAECEALDGMMPVKAGDERLKKTAVYGGYNSVKGAFFSLIEYEDKKKGIRRRIIQIPIANRDGAAQYVEGQYPGARIIVEKLPLRSRIRFGDLYLTIAGRVGDRIIFHPAMQIKIDLDLAAYAKKVERAYQKISYGKNRKQEYTLSDEDEINAKDNEALMRELCNKNERLYKNAPRAELREKISKSMDKFKSLGLENQCIVLMGMIKLLACNADSGDKDLAVLGEKTAGLSQLSFSSDITDAEVQLINQSVTGLIEREIDLNKVK